jgi:uncharacterized protein YuzE
VSIHIGPHEFNHVRYDEQGDVLYLAVDEPREAADSVLTAEGHVVRYDEANEIIGITLINAKWLLERDGWLSVSVPSSVGASAEELESAFGT